MCATVRYSPGSGGRKQSGLAEAYPRITRFCAYQERSHHEVRQKLESIGLNAEDTDAMLTRLITDGFVNEERFAKAFAGGKFRIKKWGRLKIEHALQVHHISRRCIAIGLSEIDEGDYQKALLQVVSSKAAVVQSKDPYQKWDIVSRYAIAKGYEPDLVWQVIRQLRK